MPFCSLLSNISLFILVFFVTGLASLVLTKWLTEWLRAHGFKAIPDQRSLHAEPLPVGGGWGLFVLTSLAWIILHWPMANALAWAVLAGMVVLAFISWHDDGSFVSPQIRMAFQVAAIAGALYFLPDDKLVFANVLPVWADRLVTGFCWLWFINLFNFMDGIDGITGTQTLFICSGVVIIGSYVGLPEALLYVSVVIAGAAAGFLWWNWQPAKIFLGDVGSITLGFILGWLLIQLTLEGHIAAALILPLYYLTDATLTILRRLFNGEKVWRPHKTHFYQRAAENLQSHAAVVARIAIANFVLLGAAILSITSPLIGAGLAALTVTILMVHLYRIFGR